MLPFQRTTHAAVPLSSIAISCADASNLGFDETPSTESASLSEFSPRTAGHSLPEQPDRSGGNEATLVSCGELWAAVTSQEPNAIQSSEARMAE